MYPTAPPWKRGRPGTATGWKRASSSRRARSGWPDGRRWGLAPPPPGGAPFPLGPERDPPAFAEEERGDRADRVAACQSGIVVHVDLGQRQAAAGLLDQLLQH